MRKINEEGAALIKQWESCILYAYDDKDHSHPKKFIKAGDPVKGVLSIGYGHTRQVWPGLEISQEQAENLFMRDVAIHAAEVERLVRVELSDNQFAALVSFDFNTGALHKSTLLKKLNNGDYNSVPYELQRWCKDQDPKTGKLVRVQGLVNRRAAECGLWARGGFVASRTEGVRPVKKPLFTKENMSMAGGAAAASAGVVGGAVDGDGPVQYAVAVVVVIAAAVIGYLFVRERLRD